MNDNQTNKKLPFPSLRNLQSFVEVANAGSINNAAAQLNITASAISHQISALENFLGRKLFIRNGKGVSLTLLGEEYLHQITGAMNIIGRVTDKIINEPYNEILRIHSAPSFGILWLIRKIRSFREKHPEIQINLTCSYENLQFSRDNIDIDIRHGIASWDGYKIYTIKNETLKVMASPDYLLQHPIFTPDSIAEHKIINSSATLANWARWISYHKLNSKIPEYDLVFDRSYMSFEAAKIGLGVILESSMLGSDIIKKGVLVDVFKGQFDYPISAHHIVTTHMNEQVYKVKAFIDWIREELLRDGYEL